MNVLLLGSGAREHAIAWKLSQSPLLRRLYIAPGNPGTAQLGTNVALRILDFESVALFVKDNDIDLLVVGPEDPLVNGVTDFMARHCPGLAVLGPDRKGALLEGSKNYAKQFMLRHGIPTAAHKSFTQGQLKEAVAFLDSFEPPYVIKADGLAAGKGVLICESQEEAAIVLEEMLLAGRFGKASETVLIEQFLDGIELSAFALTDGKTFVMLPEAKDYKRIGEGDTGLNTGGMGSISPVPFADHEFMDKVMERVVVPSIDGLKKEGIDYRGFLFFGLMNVAGDPYVIEYNARLGDPETESILPRISSDFLELCYAAANGQLEGMTCTISDEFSATVMVVSGGYPGDYLKGLLISGLDEASSQASIFHAGTSLNAGHEVITQGGRVLALNAMAPDLKEALRKCYAAATQIHFDGSYYRRDLGDDLLGF